MQLLMKTNLFFDDRVFPIMGAAWGAYKIMYGSGDPDPDDPIPFMPTNDRNSFTAVKSRTLLKLEQKKKNRKWYNRGRYLVYFGKIYKIIMPH